MKTSDSVVKDILAQHGAGGSAAAISKSLGIPASTVRGILKRSSVASPATTTEAPALEGASDASSVISTPQVEEMGEFITSDAANTFMTDIQAIAPAEAEVVSPEVIKETKALNSRVQLAEGILKQGTNGGRRNQLRMPTVIKTGNSDLDDLLAGIKPSTKKSRATPSRPRSPAPEAPPTARFENVVEPTPELHEPTREPSVSKAELIVKIIHNVEAFASLLGNVIGDDPQKFIKTLYSKSEKDLQVQLAVITRTRTLANVTNQLKHMVGLFAQGTEVVTQRFLNLKTAGFTTTIMTQEEELKMILKEMAMERLESFDKFQRPELRLAMLFSTTLLSVDAANRMKAGSGVGVKKQQDGKVSPATLAKNADL